MPGGRYPLGNESITSNGPTRVFSIRRLRSSRAEWLRPRCCLITAPRRQPQGNPAGSLRSALTLRPTPRKEPVHEGEATDQLYLVSRYTRVRLLGAGQEQDQRERNPNEC